MKMIKTMTTIFLIIIFFITLTLTASAGEWKQKEFVDEFGDKTGDSYVGQWAEGIFSNSSTRNSKLDAHVMIDSHLNVCIDLYEYGFAANHSPVYFNGKGYLKIKDSKGTTSEVGQYPFQGQITKWGAKGGLALRNSPYFVLDLCKAVGIVKFYIRGPHSSTYRFELSVERLAELVGPEKLEKVRKKLISDYING